jgi:thioredoxin 1
MEYLIEVKGENFQKEVLESDVPVLVDFYADWCVPCKMMAPMVAGLAKQYSDKCKIGKCNVEEDMELASRYHVLSIPTIMIFKDGSPTETIVGAVSKKELISKLEQVLG